MAPGSSYREDSRSNRLPRGVQSGLAGKEWSMKRPAAPESREAIRLLSIVIPAQNEESCIAATVEHLYVELRLHSVGHEIIVVDDGSTDSTWRVLQETRSRVPTLHAVQNKGERGFGNAITLGFSEMQGDAVVVMMGDESDDCRDVVRYWQAMNDGWDAVFGSRFVRGGGVIDYPWTKLFLNRLANTFLRMLFRVSLNDFTNAFKAYRRNVIQMCRPFISPHFNITVELPL